MTRVRIVGRGRAGGSLAVALSSVGWLVETPDRTARLEACGDGVDAVILAVPDSAIAEVAAQISPSATPILHLAGSLGLNVLAGHPQPGALHPLVSLPNAQLGSDLLLDNAWFAVAGHSIAVDIAEALGGRHFEVTDENRSRYHAAAAIASNHTVALLGQVERVAASCGVPFAAFVPLILGSVHNVAELGAAAALTGPVSRGDEATLDRHRQALDPAELDLYEAMVAAARKLLS